MPGAGSGSVIGATPNAWAPIDRKPNALLFDRPTNASSAGLATRGTLIDVDICALSQRWLSVIRAARDPPSPMPAMNAPTDVPEPEVANVQPPVPSASLFAEIPGIAPHSPALAITIAAWSIEKLLIMVFGQPRG